MQGMRSGRRDGGIFARGDSLGGRFGVVVGVDRGNGGFLGAAGKCGAEAQTVLNRRLVFDWRGFCRRENVASRAGARKIAGIRPGLGDFPRLHFSWRADISGLT